MEGRYPPTHICIHPARVVTFSWAPVKKVTRVTRLGKQTGRQVKQWVRGRRMAVIEAERWINTREKNEGKRS